MFRIFGLVTVVSVTSAALTALVVVSLMSQPLATVTPTSLLLDNQSQTATNSDSVVSVVAVANEAVVSVIATKDVPVYDRYYEDVSPWGFWGGFSVPRVRERGTEEQEVGGGSGFLVSADGLVVTNRHVVSDPEARYSVVLNDGRVFSVEVKARDPQLDIAILKIGGESASEAFSYLSFGQSDKVQLGETVIAIGNALAEFRNSVSVGVISGLSRSIRATDSRGRSEDLREVIQTDAAINPGNSGGPLLNLRGEVIGVNVATSRGADNIGFALPAHLVAPVVKSVSETGIIARPYLGVRYSMITPRLRAVNNLPYDYGALIARGDTREELAVMPGSPADRSGITEHDIILAIDGVELRTVDLATVLRSKQVGDTITLRLYQKGEEVIRSLTLAQVP